MIRFTKGFLAVLACVMFLTSCTTFSPTVINAKQEEILDTEEDILRKNVDYLTYLRLKRGAGPLDQDYIILNYRLIGDMTRNEIFTKPEERVVIALRDILNYHPTAELHPAIIHEAVERELMNTRSLWVTDGSIPYQYVLDIELSEVTVRDDTRVEKKALAAMLVLLDKNGKQVGEWFGVLKKEKGGNVWY